MALCKLDNAQGCVPPETIRPVKKLNEKLLRCRIRIGLFDLNKTSIEKIYLCNVSLNSNLHRNEKKHHFTRGGTSKL